MTQKTLAKVLLEEVGTNDVNGAGAGDGGKNQDAPKAGSNEVTDEDPNKKKVSGTDNKGVADIYGSDGAEGWEDLADLYWDTEKGAAPKKASDPKTESFRRRLR